jgi:transposase
VPSIATPEQIAHMVKLYESGKSLRDVAAIIGRSYGYVHRALSEHPDVTVRSRGAGMRRGKRHRR